MGEKHIQSFLEFLDNVKNGNIDLKVYNSNILRFVLKNGLDMGGVNSFIKALEAVNDGRIVAYSREIGNNECEVYIRF